MDAHCQAKTKKKKNVATAANTTTTPMIDDEPRAMERGGGGWEGLRRREKLEMKGIVTAKQFYRLMQNVCNFAGNVAVACLDFP